MPLFKIHRLRDSQIQQFRSAAHTSGTSQVRPRDYTQSGQIEASGLYAAWAAMRDSGEALRIGDMLEDEQGALHLCKYVGLEEAQWVVPEAPPPESVERPAE
jgi:hypothetical protein